MRRPLATGVVAVLLLFAASIGAVAWLQREGPSSSESPRASPVAREPTVATALAPPPPASAGSAASVRERPAAPTASRPQGVIPRAQPHRLARGSPAPVELFAGLNALRSSVARCVEEESRNRAALVRPARRAPVVFLLDFETLDEKVRIVDAPVQDEASASDTLIGCARGVLLGHEIRVGMSRAGSHFQLPFQLTP